MYVIATVCMLKLYQARHPDITVKSHTTWMVLAIVIIIGVGGVVSMENFMFFHQWNRRFSIYCQFSTRGTFTKGEKISHEESF